MKRDMDKLIRLFCKDNDIMYVRHEKVGEYWSVTIVASCNHEKKVLWNNLRKLSGVKDCSECYVRAPWTYDKLAGEFKAAGCCLKTTKEEFERNAMTANSFFQYYARCGHLTYTTRISHFMGGQGRKCKECTIKEASANTINKFKNNKMQNQQTEVEGYNIFVKATEETFQIIRSGEGCLADTLVRPIESDEDLWLPVQLKATPGKDAQNRYNFTLTNDYSDIVLCCIANREERFWCFDGNDIPKISCIGISKTNETSVSKYDQFECPKSDLSSKLLEMFDRVQLLDRKTALTPITDTCKTELKYRLFREERMPFIDFDYPIIQTSVYDFTVNAIKVQEKVLVAEKKCMGLAANFSKTDGKGKSKIPYEKGDNDFYWFHYTMFH